MTTSFCMENRKGYKHSNKTHTFKPEEKIPQAFFSFTIDKPIDLMSDLFAISVMQQGNRLGNYKKLKADEKFEPSQFNILLMSAKGEFIKG